MATLAEAVDHWAADETDDDRIVELVAEYGTYSATDLDRHTVPTAGDEWVYYASPTLPDHAHQTVRDFIREYRPQIKQCYANSVELCQYDQRFDYVEGVTGSAETGRVHDHAWAVFEEAFVDVTRDAAERYGVRVPNQVVRDVYPRLASENRWDILTNPILSAVARPPYSE